MDADSEPGTYDQYLLVSWMIRNTSCWLSITVPDLHHIIQSLQLLCSEFTCYPHTTQDGKAEEDLNSHHLVKQLRKVEYNHLIHLQFFSQKPLTCFFSVYCFIIMLLTLSCHSTVFHCPTQ